MKSPGNLTRVTRRFHGGKPVSRLQPRHHVVVMVLVLVLVRACRSQELAFPERPIYHRANRGLLFAVFGGNLLFFACFGSSVLSRAGTGRPRFHFQWMILASSKRPTVQVPLASQPARAGKGQPGIGRCGAKMKIT